MSITVPFSVELGRDEDAIAIVEDTVPASVPGKMKLFLGANVNPGLQQSYIGSLKACFRHLMNESARQGTVAVTVAWGDWQNASAGNIQIAGDAAGVTDDDVAIIVAGLFQGNTHFHDETFKQLINGLLERVKDN